MGGGLATMGPPPPRAGPDAIVGWRLPPRGGSGQSPTATVPPPGLWPGAIRPPGPRGGSGLPPLAHATRVPQWRGGWTSPVLPTRGGWTTPALPETYVALPVDARHCGTGEGEAIGGERLPHPEGGGRRLPGHRLRLRPGPGRLPSYAPHVKLPVVLFWRPLSPDRLGRAAIVGCGGTPLGASVCPFRRAVAAVGLAIAARACRMRSGPWGALAPARPGPAGWGGDRGEPPMGSASPLPLWHASAGRVKRASGPSAGVASGWPGYRAGHGTVVGWCQRPVAAASPRAGLWPGKHHAFAAPAPAVRLRSSPQSEQFSTWESRERQILTAHQQGLFIPRR